MDRTSVTVKGLRIALKKGPCEKCPTFDTPSRCLRTVGRTKFSMLLATGGRYLSGKGLKLRHAVLVLSSLGVRRTKACEGPRRHRGGCPLLVRGGNFEVMLLGCACKAGNLGASTPGIIGCVGQRRVGGSVLSTHEGLPSIVVTYVR